MRWRTAHRRAARRARRTASPLFKLYPYQRDMIAWLTISNRDSFTIDTGERRYQFFVATASGTDASWIRERFERELRETMEVPPEFLITNDPINPDRYRKD